MNPKQLVKISNAIGILSIVLLIYWVFIFITINVFELKVFRENITETFYLSILGILALMGGALMLNIMFNLTRIAEKNNENVVHTKNGKRFILFFMFSLPVVIGSLFLGDYFTSKNKEKLLVKTARSIVKTNELKSIHLADYKFTEDWINKTKDILDVFSRTDRSFPSIAIMVKDSIDTAPVYLGFTKFYTQHSRDSILLKKNFIRETTQPEREYLESVFEKNNKNYRYSSHDGDYELFYPYFNNGAVVVIYFSDYQRYGKIGSY